MVNRQGDVGGRSGKVGSGQWAGITSIFIRDCPINRTCRLIAHSTSDFDDRLQFYKIDYFDYF